MIDEIVLFIFIQLNLTLKFIILSIEAKITKSIYLQSWQYLLTSVTLMKKCKYCNDFLHKLFFFSFTSNILAISFKVLRSSVQELI